MKYKAQAKYDQANTKKVLLKLNLNTDKDILERLEKVGNKQGYVKRLIREDIEREMEEDATRNATQEVEEIDK